MAGEYLDTGEAYDEGYNACIDALIEEAEEMRGRFPEEAHTILHFLKNTKRRCLQI